MVKEFRLLIFKFLPDVLFYLLFLAGIIGSVLIRLLPEIAYTKLLKIVFGVLVLLGIYLIGGLHDNLAWQARVKELELKIAQSEVASTKENSKIETRIITKTNTVHERGQEVIKYVDREVVKYDTSCQIPNEFVSAHNKAAEATK